MSKTGYQVGNEVAANLEEVAALLNVSRVTKKDVAEGGKFADQVQMVQLEDEPKTDTNEAEDADVQENEEEKPFYSALGDEEVKASAEQIKESMPDFETLDELKEFIKDLDTPTLEYMARGLGLDWTPTFNASIHRMRVAMEMHKFFFPEQFQPKEPKKKKGKYGDLSTEKLFEMVDERNLIVEKSGNEPIDRMRAIMALKTVGALES